MSARIVSDATISALLDAALDTEDFTWQAPVPDDPATINAVNTHHRGQPWGEDALTAYRARARNVTTGNANTIGSMLLAENIRSVNFRFDEDDAGTPFTYTPSTPLPAGHILGIIDCFEYQACEHPGWEYSEAHAFCDALRRAQCRRVAGFHDGWMFDARH